MKTVNVVMLPTEKADYPYPNLLVVSKGLLRQSIAGGEYRRLVANKAIPQHVYLTIDRDEEDESTRIKEGDWYVWNNLQIHQFVLTSKQKELGFRADSTCKKIIASTDKSLMVDI